MPTISYNKFNVLHVKAYLFFPVSGNLRRLIPKVDKTAKKKSLPIDYQCEATKTSRQYQGVYLAE